MMFIYGVLIVVLAGLAVKFAASTGLFDGMTYTGHDEKRITWLEFGIGAAICCIIVVPLTILVGNKWALANNLTYHEWWSGYETAALRSDTECHRDGSCQFTYRCDPYEVTEIVTVPNADGKGSHTETRTHTEYHSCPEATVEWDFQIRTTLGDFHIERTFTDNPQAFRGDSVRGDVRRGVPPFWQDAANRLQAGDPRPVTVRKDYENYILASQSTILHKFSGQLDQYRSRLPAPAKDTHDFYLADKAYFVGLEARPGWQDAVMRFNAAFGSDLQGDLHLVVVDQSVTGNPDDFTGALNAYWTSTTFGRDAISKNALVVVVGTDGQTVTWARAFTGMPRGNEQLLADIGRELKGQMLDPNVVVGHPVGTVDNGEVSGLTLGKGVIEKQVWGTNKFTRVCMKCAQTGGGGFTYLGSEIQPTSGQRIIILLVATFVSLLIWAALVAIGTTNRETKSDRYLIDNEGSVLRRLVASVRRTSR